MPAVQIAQNLAFINWTVLTGLALGTYAAVILLRRRSTATRGYLGFATACAVGFGLLAWLSDGALPASLGTSPVALDPSWDGLRRTALLAFCVLAAVALLARRVRPSVAGPLDLLAVTSAVLTIVAGALGWGGGGLGTLGLLVELAALSAATGGVFAAMILGHWYLVTPKLPEAPLILLSRALLAVVGVQLLLFVAWVATGAGPADGAPFSALTGEWALFVWLRLIVGLVFPLIVCWAAVKTAQTRSMESATGLLYINVGTIAAGTILAAGLYFGAGLLV
ncbi:MAG: hypothetical protein QOD78_2596 [Chloroflexota bacterium]|nr:hypothetical protein [Chloroflexota bacterium]MEA2612841.1 hypothetical protein [Chloroflexota bacterium]